MKLQMKYWGLLAALLTMLPVPAAEAGRMTVVTHGTHPVRRPGSVRVRLRSMAG